MSKATNKVNLSLTFEKAFHYIKETYYQDRDVTKFLLVSQGPEIKRQYHLTEKILFNCNQEWWLFS